MNIYKKAFTLIELLIVIAIVGLFLAIVVAFLTDAKQKGKDTERVNSLAEVRKALQMYASDNNGFPSSTSTLKELKYISTINPAILYTGRTMDGMVCVSNSCPSYHLAVPLDNIANKVLSSDSDGITTGTINGKTKNCLDGLENIDQCYDIIP